MKYRMHELINLEPFKSSKRILVEHYGAREGNAVWSTLIDAYASLPQSSVESIWESWMDRVLNGEPVQHVVGYCWFYGLKLKVGPAALIPRPETEELVLWANQWKREKSVREGVAIDWGTGSGCIALAFKAQNPSWRVIARDLSEEAIELASENADSLKLNVEMEWCNMLENRHEEELIKADIIFSNPPYISLGERDQMAENVLKYEPFMALFAPKPDPLYFYRALLSRADEELKENGIMLLEISEYRGNATALIFEERGWYTRLEKDLSGKNRMLMVAKDADQLVNYQLI